LEEPSQLSMELVPQEKKYFMEMEDKAKIELMKRVKKAFDPNNILNPGKIF